MLRGLLLECPGYQLAVMACVLIVRVALQRGVVGLQCILQLACVRQRIAAVVVIITLVQCIELLCGTLIVACFQFGIGLAARVGIHLGCAACLPFLHESLPLLVGIAPQAGPETGSLRRHHKSTEYKQENNAHHSQLLRDNRPVNSSSTGSSHTPSSRQCVISMPCAAMASPPECGSACR